MPRALWLLIIGMAVNVTGSSFLWPLNTIYIHDHLGKSLSMAGLFNVELRSERHWKSLWRQSF